MLDNKRQEVYDELQHIEERMKKNFEPKRNKKDEPEGFENNATTQDAIIKTEQTVEKQSVQDVPAISATVETPQIEVTTEITEDKLADIEPSTIVEVNTNSNVAQDVENNDNGEPELPLVQSESNESVPQDSQSLTDTDMTEAKDTDTQEQE